MIDTVKLVLTFSQRPKWVQEARMRQSVDANTGIFKATSNPSSYHKKMGIYQPRLTYMERPSRNGSKTYELAIELSLPKLKNGNNFTELVDADFKPLCEELHKVIKETYGIWLFTHQIEQADVRKVDFSKNIVFTDRTPVSSILSSISTANISKVYDVQDTNFRNGGHIYHVHTNSLDIAIYDKVADLKQEKKSSKRSRERDGYTQTSLIDLLERKKTVSVTRFEVRLNGLRKIRQELKSVGLEEKTDFKTLFKQDISRLILLKHWKNIFDKIPKAPMFDDTPESLFIELSKANPDMKLTEGLARIGFAYLRGQHDERYIRNLAEELYSPSQYRRFMQKARDPPSKSQLKSLLHIESELTAMKPVSIDDYVL